MINNQYKMTKKKTPPPVKKAAPEKNKEYKWTQTGETKIPGIDAVVRTYDVQVPEEEANAMFKSLVKENQRLNELLLLSKHQSEQMPQIQNPLQQRATMLSQFAEQLDGQLSRFCNSLNTLDALANRLLIQKEDGVKGNVPEAHDLSSRYSNIVSYFSAQNDRLDFLNTKLSDLI